MYQGSYIIPELFNTDKYNHIKSPSKIIIWIFLIIPLIMIIEHK